MPKVFELSRYFLCDWAWAGRAKYEEKKFLRILAPFHKYYLICHLQKCFAGPFFGPELFFSIGR
jgi:hypothetical protein